MEVFKNIMLVLLGMLIAVAIFCLVVGVGCAVHGVTFGQQIVDWFGKTAAAADDVAQTTAMITPII